MIDKNYRIAEGDVNEDFEYAKKEILSILKERKVSLSKTRRLFNCILDEGEDNNSIALPLENKNTESTVIVVPKDYPVYTMPSYQLSKGRKKKLIPVEPV